MAHAEEERTRIDLDDRIAVSAHFSRNSATRLCPLDRLSLPRSRRSVFVSRTLRGRSRTHEFTSNSLLVVVHEGDTSHTVYTADATDTRARTFGRKLAINPAMSPCERLATQSTIRTIARSNGNSATMYYRRRVNGS